MKHYIMLVMVVLVFSVLSGCSDEKNIKITQEENVNLKENYKEETNENNDFEIFNDMLFIDQIEDINDITDEMVIDKKVEMYCEKMNRNPKKDEYTVTFEQLTGVDYGITITAEEETKVKINYDVTLSDGSFQLKLLKADKTLETLAENTKKEGASYSIPKGDSYIALIGYHADLSLKINIEPQEKIAVKMKKLF